MKTPDIAEQTGAFVERFTVDATHSGPLSDLTFAVKDLIDITGHVTGCGNPTWADTHPPAVTNAVCVDQLLQAGATCCGKTITDELAFSLLGENAHFGTPLNPRAPDRVPGGSSSGSASAVAAGLVDFALGTDTGGSVRVPAANCGLVGIRPTHGRISVAGVMPFAPTYDTVGVLARDLSVLTAAASSLLGCTVPKETEVGTIHVIPEAFAIADPEVREALQPSLARLRAIYGKRVRETPVREISGEDRLEYWYEVYGVVQWAEIWSSLGAWVEAANPDFGPRTARSFELARTLDRSGLSEAVARRESLARRMRAFLGPCDLLCIPTSCSPAPLKGSVGLDRSKDVYHLRALSLTSISGVTRQPQITLPVADAAGLPVGLSLLGAVDEDAHLLAVAAEVMAA